MRANADEQGQMPPRGQEEVLTSPAPAYCALGNEAHRPCAGDGEKPPRINTPCQNLLEGFPPR